MEYSCAMANLSIYRLDLIAHKMATWNGENSTWRSEQLWICRFNSYPTASLFGIRRLGIPDHDVWDGIDSLFITSERSPTVAPSPI